jgi:hypothetical protein
VEAARGLIAFRLGNINGGREHYIRAIESCREIASEGLIANAAMYWLEQELFAGTAEPEETRITVAKLDEFYSRKENGSGKSPVWSVRKKVITAMAEENAKRTSFLAEVNFIEQPKMSDLMETKAPLLIE